MRYGDGHDDAPIVVNSIWGGGSTFAGTLIGVEESAGLGDAGAYGAV